VNRDAIWISLVAFSITLLLVFASYISYRSASRLVEHGEHTTGQVIAFTKVQLRGRAYPEFVFIAKDGRQFHVVSAIYTVFAPRHLGETVPVVYPASAPQDARIADRSSLYGLAYWCAGVAVFLLCFAVTAFLMRHKTHASHSHPYIRAGSHGVMIDVTQAPDRWAIPKGHRLRIALWSCALLSLPIVAAVTSDRSLVIIVSILALGFEAFLLLFSSMPDQPNAVKAMRVTNFYSRGYLWFQGTFWTLLMLFVLWRLYLQSLV
jgi:hypothetical protein